MSKSSATKGNKVYVSISIPEDFYKIIRKIGGNSPSAGVYVLWERIKDSKEVKDLKKFFNLED